MDFWDPFAEDYYVEDCVESLENEWDREWIEKNHPVPYETLGEMKAAFIKGEINFAAAKEYVERKFFPMPQTARQLVQSWVA